ncbi:hypothetical protein FRACYDRAFT_248596 [Fragilariopsis cylindrus CCMP1102]|uniref:Uncharacterized protein n=1 Tax=Fragilariopsis cylindrus CCMP1102 TaxID=635003 RepID=A0A1E7ETB0_9STRA|nr:hypothetical protein FRACYDRAFT_248596 [Fragilariopsis cylindrus CCMP1102]|eukprot:OEU09260.1 hypothetical protein FRACYDRAFT_248596 [Fragilariopsis cylindrus CCMP1102]
MFLELSDGNEGTEARYGLDACTIDCKPKLKKFLILRRGEAGKRMQWHRDKIEEIPRCYYQPVAAFTTSTATNGRARNQNHRYRGMDKNVHNKSNVFNKNDDEKEEKDHQKESSSSPWKLQLKNAYDQRVNADPSFFSKSITEIIVAAGTQLMAELNRRGVSRIIPELDFVLPAIFAAIFGKYYSMWRTAKTLDSNDGESYDSKILKSSKSSTSSSTTGDSIVFGLPVPTNFFQPYMADGMTLPTTKQRFGSFLAPVPALFRAGTIASGVGYGIVAVIIALRSMLIPSYRTETIPVNVFYASIYTGCFMAVVSNIRYQLLQGIIEPIFIDRWLFSNILVINKYKNNNKNDGIDNTKRTNSYRFQIVLRSFTIFAVRWLNGLLGSVLAILV